MKSRIARAARVAALVALVATSMAAGPCSMFPGRQVEGQIAPHPGTWEMLGEGTQCALEVNPASPASVYIDCYTVDGQLYVHSHRFARLPRLWGEAWVTAAEREPEVRLAHAGRIYPLRARRIDDASLRLRVLAARGFDPVPEGIVLFALEPRG